MIVSFSRAAAIKAAICVAALLVSAFTPIDALESAGPRICFVIFVTAAALWTTELIPAFATSIMVIVACVYLLGSPDGPLELMQNGTQNWEFFLNPIASPVIVLFFGSYILAIGATKHGFDVRLAKAFITPFGTRPSWLLLGVIVTTAAFSMFMSNTATAAMMIAVAKPLLHQLENRKRFVKMIVLAIPFAANIGGLGTIIGTPPNAVAASVLHHRGSQYEISFLKWMIIGVPIVIVLLTILWGVLLLIFRPKPEAVEIQFPKHIEVTPGLAIVIATFTITILMWLTQPLHAIPSAVVAMLPIAIFSACGIVDASDLKRVDWDILILVAGGLTLGSAMSVSGLSEIIVDEIPFGSMPRFLILSVIMLVGLAMSNFMSNTAASNLIIPIACSIAAIEPRSGALAAAFGCSLAMSLPISTPPNAIAFATHAVTTRELVKYGTSISLIGLAMLMCFFILLGDFIGNL